MRYVEADTEFAYYALASGAEQVALLRIFVEPDLVVLDDMFLARRISEASAESLQTVVHQRYKQRRSLIVTSNRVVQDWGKYLGDATVAATILDRLMRRAATLEFEGKSYRLKQALRAWRSMRPSTHNSAVLRGEFDRPQVGEFEVAIRAPSWYPRMAVPMPEQSDNLPAMSSASSGYTSATSTSSSSRCSKAREFIFTTSRGTCRESTTVARSISCSSSRLADAYSNAIRFLSLAWSVLVMWIVPAWPAGLSRKRRRYRSEVIAKLRRAGLWLSSRNPAR